jgi:succinoglycan biosynthesis transport protein ExoP
MSTAQRARTNQAQQLETEIQSIDAQISSKEADVARLRKVASEYQLRVEAVPMRQAEMTELTRDYSVLQNLYQSLLSKKEESQIAANLERRQVGEQFKLLDPAQMPQKPFSPDRLQLNAIGAALGLALGIGLAAFQEFKDSSFRTDSDVTGVLELPVLARIPLMLNQFELRQLRRRRIAFSVMAVIIVVLAGTGWKLGVVPVQSLQRLVR